MIILRTLRGGTLLGIDAELLHPPVCRSLVCRLTRLGWVQAPCADVLERPQ